MISLSKLLCLDRQGNHPDDLKAELVHFGHTFRHSKNIYLGATSVIISDGKKVVDFSMFMRKTDQQRKVGLCSFITTKISQSNAINFSRC